VTASTLQSTLVDFMTATDLGDVDDAVLADARRSLADSIACQVAGVVADPIRPLLMAGGPSGSSPILGARLCTSAPRSALIGGMAATWHDLDSGHRHPSSAPPVPGGHTPVHVIPVLLALGTPRAMSGRELLRCYLVTYEFGARIAIASSLRQGLHTHGVHATAAAGAAAALATGGDPDLVDRSTRLATGLNIMPSMRAPLEGGSVRNSFAGVGAMHGVLAERMARAGFQPEHDPDVTIYGGIAATGFDPEVAVERLGTHWESTLGYYKVHACCRWNHPALDALEDLMARTSLEIEDIERIRVRTFGFAAQMTDRSPMNDMGAKFSLPWSIAAYLVLGSTGPEGYTAEAIADERIRGLAGRVEVVEDRAYSAQLPVRRPTTIEVHNADGSLAAATVLGSRGDPADRFDDDRMDAKFQSLVEMVLGEGSARRSLEMLHEIETLDEVGTLVRELGGSA
jgi:2-methylcitrate dehydratase PrpD